MKKKMSTTAAVILSSSLFIILGLVLVFWPEITGLVICYALGVLILVFAISRIISFFSEKQVSFIYKLDIIIGLIAGAVGIFMLVRPDIVILILPLVIGLFFVFSSALDIQKAFILREFENKRWKSSLVLAVIKLIFGILMLVAPSIFAFAMIRIIGISMIYNGLSELWIASRWPKIDEYAGN